MTSHSYIIQRDTYNKILTYILVNDEKVSDGEEGCDRAGLIFKCIVENAPKVKKYFITIE